MALLRRLCGAVLTLPLIISERFGRFGNAKKLAAPSRSRSRSVGTPPPRDTAPDKLTRPGPSSADLRRMRDELRRVLDERDEGRLAFRHLDRFERKFSLAGLRILDKLPTDQLRAALVDFESLVSNWSSAPLAELRSRMAVALSDRTSASTMWIPPARIAAEHRPDATLAGHTPPPAVEAAAPAPPPVDIATVSMSRFEAAGGEWRVAESGGAVA